ncbi:MAG: hypothetical protein ACREQW_22670 [Candidatus Binatia bacterium]
MNLTEMQRLKKAKCWRIRTASLLLYWTMNLALRGEAIRAQFAYLDEKEFAQAKISDPKDFFDNSFVETLDKTRISLQARQEPITARI